MPEAEGELPPSYLRELEKQTKALIDSVWDSTSPIDGRGMLELVGKTLHGNMMNGFGKSFTSVDWSTPDTDMLVRLTRDVWQFSAAKNYQQLRDMSMALRDDDGKLRTFAEFEEKALVINSQYNRTWLATEYSQAVNSATMAARWNDFTRNAKDMPYLRYRTVGDNNVRNEHKLLDGITRKVNDSFWDTHFPPNGWKCRCDADQVAGSRAKETDVIPNASIPPMFQTNLAKTGLVFPKGHPYYTDVPPEVLRQNLAYLPPDAAYNKATIEGKEAQIHLLHNEVSADGIRQLKQHTEITGDLYKLGYKDAKLLPNIHEQDKGIKQGFYPKGYKPFDVRKNPDAWIKDAKGNNLVCDYKHMNGTGRNLPGHLKKGATLSEFVVVKLANPNHTMTAGRVTGLINATMKEYDHLKGIVVLDHKGAVLAQGFKK